MRTLIVSGLPVGRAELGNICHTITYDAEPVSTDRQSLLTARERQVLALIAAGKRSKEIAVELGITLRTVNTHREKLAKKLGTSNPAGFIRFAIDNGITNTD